MSGLILHHYAASPFSEKMRLIFGFKGLSWQSVTSGDCVRIGAPDSLASWRPVHPPFVGDDVRSLWPPRASVRFVTSSPT